MGEFFGVAFDGADCLAGRRRCSGRALNRFERRGNPSVSSADFAFSSLSIC